MAAGLTAGLPLLAQKAVPGGEAFTVKREVYLPSPAPGVTVLAASYYARPTGLELLGRHHWMTRSDTVDRSFVRFSANNGHQWSDAEVSPAIARRAEGTFRRVSAGAFLDPTTGWLLDFRIEGVFPTDTPLGRLKNWYIGYAISKDGGRSWTETSPVVNQGAEYSSEHPLPGVWRGKNCAYLGDIAATPIGLADRTVLVPIQIVPLGADGKLFNPGGGYTYRHAAVLVGRWNRDRVLTWNMSAPVEADPALSTRGMIEPTVAEIEDGRLIMVMRGANDRRPDLFGGRWISFSTDAGRTWTAPAYWTYSDGTRFHSPSACSQLLRHSSGRLFWLGNISPHNPVGNRPRYPFVIAEVNRRTGGLERQTVTIIDDREPGDSELLALSNFSAREDRESGEIRLHMTRQGEKSIAGKLDFTASAYVYRIRVV